jgi:uncharacterized protein YjdB
MRFPTLAAAFTGLTLLVACGGSTTDGVTDIGADTADFARTASVAVSLASASIDVGGSTTATATVRDGRGRIVTKSVEWSTSNASVATVSSFGVVTGVAAGSANIIATSGNKSGNATVTVNMVAVPDPGATSDLSATATGSASVTLTFTQVNNGAGAPASYDVRYAVAPLQWGSASSVATGTCATPLAGTATSGALSCTVLGLSPSTKYNFQVVAYRGTLGTDATFGPLSNVAEATTAAETVNPVPTSVTVAPTSASIVVGGSQSFTATVKDQNGSAMACSSLAWSSQNTGVVTVAASGLASGVAAGSTTVKATCGSASGTANVTVTAAPSVATTVSVAPTSASIAAGATKSFTATVKDQNGATMSCGSLGWTSQNTGIATINASGLATGVAAGTTTVKAACGAVSGTANLTVTAVTPPPTGGDTVFYENWEANSFNKWQDGYKPSTQKINTDGGAYEGSRYLDVTYSGSEDGGWLTTWFMPGYDSLYVRAYVKLSSNFTGGTKLLGFTGSRTDNMWSAFGTAGKCPNGTDFFTTSAVTEPTGGTSTTTPPVRIYTYYYGMAREPDGVTCWGRYGDGNEQYYPPTQLSLGTWHKVEFWVRINNIGQSNGSQKLWIDGKLEGDWSGIQFRTSTILKLNALQLVFSSISAATGHMYVDDILVLANKPSP